MAVFIMKSKKFTDITSSARELFWKHGFRRVSIEEICLKANVSKMTFYRFFPNKTAVAKTVFDEVFDEGVKQFKSILSDDTPAPEKLKKMLLLKLEGTNDISREFLQDFYGNPELGLSAYIDQKNKLFRDEIIEDIRVAQSKGVFRSDFKPEFFLLLSGKVGEMINDENMLKLYNTPQELVLEIAGFFTYGISAHT
jgi:AcrR family transcriptional regulator